MENIIKLSIFQYMKEIITTFQLFAQTNPVIGGVITLWVLGVFSFIYKDVPKKLLEFITKQLTVSVVIHNYDEVFQDFTIWYEDAGFSKKARILTANNNSYGTGSVNLSFGKGVHYIFIGLRLFKIERTEKDSIGIRPKETIKISILGRSQEPIRSLFSMCKKKIDKNKETKVYTWETNGWTFSHRQVSRSMDSAILSNSIRENLIEEIEEFLLSEDYYIMHGIPYQFGINFSGIPGTGKTTLSKCLCGYFKKDLYKINLSSVGDTSFEKALLTAGKDAVVSIEDIDCFSSTNKRNAVQRSVDESKDTKSEEDTVLEGRSSGFSFLTLSGILNAIDGSTSACGRILVMTTNNIDALDPAILRKGRTDLKIVLGPLNKETFIYGMKRFYPNYDMPKGEFTIKKGISPAEFQGMVLNNKNKPDKVVELCGE